MVDPARTIRTAPPSLTGLFRPVPDLTGFLPEPARAWPLAGRLRATGRRLAGLYRSPTVWVMGLLVLVSFLQQPGKVTFDTKLDLPVNPIGFLARALHLWNPEATSGELQNQAYGYLFPVGPFFAGCQLLGIPPWVAQRLWCALLLCLAYAGMVLLARALGIGTEPARHIGALAYALAPRMLTEIGPVSVELLPAVMLPWVLLPLVRAGRIGSPRRAAGLSGLAVLCMSGVNGAMVVMALVLPGLWLLTRTWTAQHVKLVLWWVASVLAACLWWILPLLLLGQYSMPFVDYVESASNTTAAASLFQVLRGTNQWVAYIVQGTPWWPSGFLLVDDPALMIATGLAAAVGLAGLARWGLRERRFLVLGVVTCTALLTVGYVGALDSPLSEVVRGLLDGPLAPLRNVHKYEPGLRLALALGFMHAVSGRLPGLTPYTSRRWAVRARLAIGVLLVVAISAPAWLFTLRQGPGWTDIPGYWRSAMTWLGDAGSQSRTLMLPATGFGDYKWGHTVDEPAQPLAEAPWAVRGQSPLGSEGNTRVMDTVEEVLASGRGSPALADYLVRSGYRFLLLRNDVDRAATGSPPRAVLRAALAASPGIVRVATFGPEQAAQRGPGEDQIDVTGPPVPTLEIYAVRRPVPPASAVVADDVPTVSGGPESLLPLLEAGLLEAGEPVVLAGDGGSTQAARWLVTDGLRYRERNVGRVRDNLSQTMTPEETSRQGRAAIDLLPFTGLEHQTTAAYRGVRAVRASSSAGFADAWGETDPSRQPFAAIDGDLNTYWRSSSLTGPAEQWLEVELDTPRPVSEVTLRFVDDVRVGWPVRRIRITTDSGSVDHDVPRQLEPRTFATAPGLTGTVRVTVLSVAADREEGHVGIAELRIPGVSGQRALEVPADAGPRPAGFAFSRGNLPRYPCLSDDGGQRCNPGLVRSGEEPAGINRLFRTSAPAQFRVAGTVLPTGRVPLTLPGLEVSSSTQLGGDPAAGPLSAVDGDPGTTWVSDVGDLRPRLRLAWSGQRTITGIHLSTDPASGAGRPAEVRITTPAGDQDVPLDDDGRASIDVTSEWIEIGITQTGADGSRRYTGPPGISELSVSGLDDLIEPIDPQTPFTVPCGAGPALHIDGFSYATTVSGTLADLVAHRRLALGTCADLAEGVDLEAGRHELSTDQTAEFVVQDLWLMRTGSIVGVTRQREVSIQQWDIAHRRIAVAAGPEAILRIPENANDGWVATVDGQPLRATRVDGWQQAWQLPAGENIVVSLDFQPDSAYRNRLLAGGVAVLALLIAVLLPVRRRVIRPMMAGGRLWVPVVLAGLLGLLGGMLAIALLLGCLLLRAIWRPAPLVLAPVGMVVATVAAVAGRLGGEGQALAYGPVAQAALLVSVAAVAAASIDWFDRRTPPPRGEAAGAGRG